MFFSSFALFKNLFPTPQCEGNTGFTFQRKNPKPLTCQAADMQAVNTQPTLGPASVTEQRNRCRSAIQASRNASASAGSREEGSVLACVMELSCYDPADGGGHFPGNEVTDGH